MDVGIGLPNAVRGVGRAGIVEWARRADQAGFSSLGTLDRLAYANYESLIALAAAAAVTDRIGLVTDILIAPLRSNAALLAKQAATIDSLSGGRLTLGLAVGGRPDDFELSKVDFHRRGQIFEQQLDDMTSIWRGETSIGPAPVRGERPGLLIGGSSDAAFRRAARHADGWTMGGGGPDMFAAALEKLNVAWSAAGRQDKPRTSALFYFAIGDDAEERVRDTLGDYYSFLGDYAERIVTGAAKSADDVRRFLSAFEQAGADEVICFPTSYELDQVDRLADAALGQMPEHVDLSSIPLFAALSPEDRATAARVARPLAWDVGHVVVKEGEFAFDFYAITRGAAEVRQGDKVLRKLGAGDFFGELGVIPLEGSRSSRRRTASVVVTAPTSAIAISGGDMRPLAQDVPALGDALRSAAAERARDDTA